MDEAWTPHRCFCPHWASVHCLDVRHIICDLLQCIPKDLAAYGVIYRFNELISQKPGITMSLGKNTDNYSIFFEESACYQPDSPKQSSWLYERIIYLEDCFEASAWFFLGCQCKLLFLHSLHWSWKKLSVQNILFYILFNLHIVQKHIDKHCILL